MTAQEAREAVRGNVDSTCRGISRKIYERIQTKIKEAVLEGNLSCEYRVPVTAYYMTKDEQVHSSPNYPRLSAALSLLRADGFYCRISQSGENWKVEVEW